MDECGCSTSPILLVGNSYQSLPFLSDSLQAYHGFQGHFQWAFLNPFLTGSNGEWWQGRLPLFLRSQDSCLGLGVDSLPLCPPRNCSVIQYTTVCSSSKHTTRKTFLFYGEVLQETFTNHLMCIL